MAVVANMALAVELFLKAADAKITSSKRGVDGPLGCAKIQSNLRGHDLKELFDSLEPTVSSRFIVTDRQKPYQYTISQDVNHPDAHEIARHLHAGLAQAVAKF